MSIGLDLFITKPEKNDILKKYGSSLLHRVKEISNNDEIVINYIAEWLVYIEWYFLFLEKINEINGGKLTEKKQKNEYSAFLKIVKSTHSKMIKYYKKEQKPEFDLPDDLGNILDNINNQLSSCSNIDITAASEIINLLKDFFGVKRIKINQDRRNIQILSKALPYTLEK